MIEKTGLATSRPATLGSRQASSSLVFSETPRRREEMARTSVREPK
jgi:hypothetical protein